MKQGQQEKPEKIEKQENRWLIRLAWAIAILCLFFALNTDQKQMKAIDNTFAYLNAELIVR